MPTGKTPDDSENQPPAQYSYSKRNGRVCAHSRAMSRVGTSVSSVLLHILLSSPGRMKHKHAQTHDEVSAEPELSYDVMGTGSFRLLE